jgi:hypothetical protein
MNTTSMMKVWRHSQYENRNAHQDVHIKGLANIGLASLSQAAEDARNANYFRIVRIITSANTQ